jgi:hypothetical protein
MQRINAIAAAAADATTRQTQLKQMQTTRVQKQMQPKYHASSSS